MLVSEPDPVVELPIEPPTVTNPRGVGYGAALSDLTRLLVNSPVARHLRVEPGESRMVARQIRLEFRRMTSEGQPL